MSVNKVIIVGFVGREPETRAFQDGTGVTNFSVATSEKYKDKASGEYRENTEWHRISCFGKLSEIASKLVTKGSQVYVEGKLVTRKWKDTNGVEKSSTEIRADVLQMLGSKEVRQPSIDIGTISNHASQSLGELLDDVPF
jgi:single-strand DNA-binding protein